MIVTEWPIMPVRLTEAVAFLRDGQGLRHRRTGNIHDIQQVVAMKHRRVDTVGNDKIVTEGTALCVDFGMFRYVPFAPTNPHQSHIDQLWQDYEPPQFNDQPFGFNTYHTELDRYQRETGFTYYYGQRNVIARCACCPGAIIAVETGGGKTLIGISLARISSSWQAKSTLLLVPQGVMTQWIDELARFWHDSGVRRLTKADIDAYGRVAPGVWLSYHEEFLLNDDGLVAHCSPQAFATVVIDEIHLRQNPDSVMGNRIWKLTPTHRYVLTATPITNRISDIYSLCRWVRPDIEFKHTHHKSTRITSDSRRIPTDDTYLPVDPALFSAELMRVVVAVRKIDLRPDLPPITVNIHRVAMSKEHRDIYDFISNDWRPKKGDAGTVTRLRMSKQRETCVKTGDFNARNRFVLDHIIELHYQGEQVVVGCARTEQSSWLAGELKKLGIKFSRIDSTRAASKHAAEADKFKSGDTQVMLIGVRCAYGYSFPECAHGILASPEWGLGTAIQFYGRFYRLNSNRPVTCDVFICKDTVEEEMADTLGLKEHAANTVLFGNNHHPIMADSLASVD